MPRPDGRALKWRLGFTSEWAAAVMEVSTDRLRGHRHHLAALTCTRTLQLPSWRLAPVLGKDCEVGEALLLLGIASCPRSSSPVSAGACWMGPPGIRGTQQGRAKGTTDRGRSSCLLSGALTHYCISHQWPACCWQAGALASASPGGHRGA